jgi:hypothetical protein
MCKCLRVFHSDFVNTVFEGILNLYILYFWYVLTQMILEPKAYFSRPGYSDVCVYLLTLTVIFNLEQNA